MTGNMACMIVGILSFLCSIGGFVLVKKRIWTIGGAIIHIGYQIFVFTLFIAFVQMM